MMMQTRSAKEIRSIEEDLNQEYFADLREKENNERMMREFAKLNPGANKK